MELDIQKMIFDFIGGLAIFLFGIKYMSNGLQKFAGYKLKESIDRYLTNPLIGVLVGIIVTILIDSSSGTTVIVVGLVSAGYMSLRQSIGIIMGANIGTSVNAFVININILEYSSPVIFIGVILLFIYKNKRIFTIGKIIFGLGALFWGLELMANSLNPLSTLEGFYELTVRMSDNAFTGVIFGTIFTIMVQSSSVTIGVLQELVGKGFLDIREALPVLFGNNIGTTITALLASIGTSISARRAALTHVLFNIIGTVIFIIFTPLFSSFILYLQQIMFLKSEITIALADGLFNITNTFIQLPLIGVLVLIVTKLIPGKDTRMLYKVKDLDPIFIEQSTSIAISQTKEALVLMGKYAALGIEESKLYQLTYSQKNADTAIILEDVINNFDRKITEYLILIAKSDISKTVCDEHNMLLDSVRDVERVGDHFVSIIELVSNQVGNKIQLSDSAKKDLVEMFELTLHLFKDAMTALDDSNTTLALKVLKTKEKIHHLECRLRDKHLKRMNEGTCSISAGLNFVDIISNLKSVGDHSGKIAEAVLRYLSYY
jgi:phosphate:Na+ symporter